MFDSEDAKDQHPPATGQISIDLQDLWSFFLPWDIPSVVNVYIVIVWYLMVIIMVNSDIMMIHGDIPSGNLLQFANWKMAQSK